MKRAALYARYSSDLQSARSCEDQLALLREEAAKRGWRVVREYRDEAISGASIFARPGMLAMLRDAEAQAFDTVFAEALDRISRDEVDSPAIRKRLNFHGVALWTLSEGEVQILHTALKGAMNAMFLDELGRKVRRGMRGVIADGRSAGGKSFGYDLVPGGRGQLVINEAEAAIVRRIFRAYADDDASPRAIALQLNAEGVPGPTGAWKRGAIKSNAGWGMLHNPLYRGELVWNRRRSRKHPETGAKGYLANPESEWKRQAVPHLRIVDEALWARAQARAASLTHKRGGAKRPQRIFSGLLRCATCGGPMHSYGRLYYGCYSHHYSRQCANARMIRESEILDRAIAGLQRELLSPAAVRNATRAFRAELDRLQSESGGRRASLEAEIADTGRRIARLVAAIEAGAASAEASARIADLAARRQDAQAELAGLDSRAVIGLRPDFDRLYRDAIDQLAGVIAAAGHAADALRTDFRRFIHGIVLTPHPGPRGYAMEIHGDLATFFHLEMTLKGRPKCPN